mgnify:CR=1 FL=1
MFLLPPDVTFRFLVYFDKLTDNDLERARWLPSIEPWDWIRPDDVATDGHWFTYTSGVVAGMLNDPNYDHSLKTEVYLGRL